MFVHCAGCCSSGSSSSCVHSMGCQSKHHCRQPIVVIAQYRRYWQTPAIQQPLDTAFVRPRGWADWALTRLDSGSGSAYQWTGCISSTWSTCSNSSLVFLFSSNRRTSMASVPSGTRSSSMSASSSSTAGRGSITFGPGEFIELFRSRAMSLVSGDNRRASGHQRRRRHRVCVYIMWI